MWQPEISIKSHMVSYCSVIKTRSHTVPEINVFLHCTQIPDGCQKWRESNFCEMSPVDPADTLRVKNFVKITPSGTVSELNLLLRFTQKFKMAAKNGGKAIFGESRQ